MDDFKVKHILNLNGYFFEPKQNDQYYINNKIPYFYQNDNEICTGFSISTIDGLLRYPIIGMKDVRKRISITKEIPSVIDKIKRKYLNKVYIILFQYQRNTKGNKYLPKTQGNKYLPKTQGNKYLPKTQGNKYLPKTQGNKYLPKELLDLIMNYLL